MFEILYRIAWIKRWKEEFFFVSRGFEFFKGKDQDFSLRPRWVEIRIPGEALNQPNLPPSTLLRIQQALDWAKDENTINNFWTHGYWLI
jgi:hypothetical protein